MSKSKPQRVVSSKNLSGLGGVRDVSFGDAPPERRAQGDYSKDGISKVESDTFDDYNERADRWSKGLFGL
jgi:hypothetical protein